MNEAAERASEYWAVDRSVEGTGERPRSWLQHQTILQVVNRRVSGDPNVSTMQWFRNKYFPRPVDLALSLGCGFGGFERFGIAAGIARKFHANDLSDGAIAKAREVAAAEGFGDKIDYSVVNLDECTLPAATYDAVFALSSAHHVFRLENLFRQCRKTLKPNGLLFMDEYIGPSRFQSAPEVTALINKLRDILPERYRKSLFTDDGSLIHPYVPSPPEHFEKHDPSEAVRSGEIVSTLKMYFDILEYRPYGGAIMHMLFSGIMGNFNENSEADVALLRTIATFEEIMEGAGLIGSDFAAIVAKPKQVLPELAEYA